MPAPPKEVAAPAREAAPPARAGTECSFPPGHAGRGGSVCLSGVPGRPAAPGGRTPRFGAAQAARQGPMRVITPSVLRAIASRRLPGHPRRLPGQGVAGAGSTIPASLGAPCEATSSM